MNWCRDGPPMNGRRPTFQARGEPIMLTASLTRGRAWFIAAALVLTVASPAPAQFLLGNGGGFGGQFGGQFGGGQFGGQFGGGQFGGQFGGGQFGGQFG